MYAIVHKSDGYPICRQVEGVSPDPKAFLAARGAEAEYQPVRLDDEAMERMARAMGCAVEAVTFEPYPG
jgi:hypothetical protein